MSWHIGFTRFASAHLVKKQEKENSCGIACILMVNFKMRKGLMAHGVAAGASMAIAPIPGGTFLGAALSKAAIDWAVKSEPQVYKIYGDVVGTIYDGTDYTNGLKHPEVLRRLGLGNWECVNAGANGIAAAVKAATDKGAPCIVHVAWKSGGAHFVVVDDVFRRDGKNFACVNDPGDGEVVVTGMPAGAAVSYLQNTGSFTGWIIRKA